MESRTTRKSKMTRIDGKPDSTKPDSGLPVKKNHYTTVKMAPCKICTRESSGYHFGVVTCEACKAFFRRAISKNSKIPEACRAGNFQCGENHVKITGCPACRLQRCKDLGMSKGGARKGRYSLKLRTQSILDAKLEQEKREQSERQSELQPQANESPTQFNCSHSTMNEIPMTNFTPEGVYDTTYVPNGDVCSSFNENSVNVNNEPESRHLSPEELHRKWMRIDKDYMDDFTDFSLQPIDVSQNPSDYFQSPCKSPNSSEDCVSKFTTLDTYNPVPHMDNKSPVPLIDPKSPVSLIDPKRPLPLIPVEDETNYENLISELIKLQERLFPHKICDDDIVQRQKKIEVNIVQRQKEIEDEHIQREEAYQFMFGATRTEYASPKEFNEVLSEVNIELDDRLKVLREKGTDNEKNIVLYIQHSRYIPGFHTLDLDDMLLLLKESYFEFWLISNHRYFDGQRGVSGGSDAVCNAHKKVISSLFPKEYVEATFSYTDTLKKLELTLEEVAIVRVIILTFTDRCQLKHPSRVEKLQNLFIKCLIYQLSKHYDNYRTRLCRIFERLVEIRTLGNMNVYVNQQFVKNWSFMLKEFPLWREMLSHHVPQEKDNG